MILNKTIIKLGRNTLIYGDSTNNEIYDLIPQVDLLLTDPPYNVNYSGSRTKRRKLMNDNLKGRYKQFVFDFLENTYNILKPGSPYYIFCSGTEIRTYSEVLDSLDYYQSTGLVWTKNHFVLSFADYKSKHEHILYGWKKGAAHKFYGAKNCSTVLNYSKPHRSKHHPTMKPRDLLRELILNSTRENDTILDVFGGSGNTLLEAESLNRKCILIELDLEYIKTIINRYKYHYPNQQVQIIEL